MTIGLTIVVFLLVSVTMLLTAIYCKLEEFYEMVRMMFTEASRDNDACTFTIRLMRKEDPRR